MLGIETSCDETVAAVVHADGQVEFRTNPQWFTDYMRRTTVEWDEPRREAAE